MIALLFLGLLAVGAASYVEGDIRRGSISAGIRRSAGLDGVSAMMGHETALTAADKVKAAIASRNPQKIAKAALALRKSHPQTANALADKALKLSQPKTIPSALTGVEDMGWTAFVRAMASKPAKATGDGRLGIFRMSKRRLADLGYCTNPRKEQNDIGRPIWEADWKAEGGEEGFKKSPKMQYDAFAKSARDHARAVLTEASGAVGEEIEGEECTLSGLLGVAHVAGKEGMKSWLKSPKDRERFPATTMAYHKANGLF